MTNCELKLSFNRAPPYNSVLKLEDTKELVKPFELKDVVAITEYVSSPIIREKFSIIDYQPFTYEFDECDLLGKVKVETFMELYSVKNIPSNEREIRFDNLHGGVVPECMFIALIPQRNLSGDFADSSTHFQWNSVQEMNISLNGNSVDGYPMLCKYGSPVQALQKFIQTTGRHYNIHSPGTLDLTEFTSSWIWSHKFEAETSSRGWIGVNFTLEKAFTDDIAMAMVVWVVSKQAVSLDKYHQIERIKL